jgi:hypothetical protein
MLSLSFFALFCLGFGLVWCVWRAAVAVPCHEAFSLLCGAPDKKGMEKKY